MKRFLLIFVIAFGGLVATIGGIVGIKYLGGEFDTPVIMPEGIVFESTEYEIDGSLDTYQITIKSTNEDSTQNKVKLAFSNSDRLTDDKLHITDGNIIVPINVELNKPFTIQIVKDKSHTELQELGYTGNWTHGGVSQIVASSENIKAKYATASIYVDVPVYKTEIIMLSGESGDDDLQTIFGSIENSSLALSLETEDGEEYKSISSGQDVYLGIKFYPYDSAFRYSKIKATNVYSEFKNKITELCNAKNVNFDDLFADFDAEISNTRAKALIEGYSSIMNNALNVLGNDFVNLIHNFESNLKYTNIVEVANSNKLNFIKRITGTNIYKFKSNTTLGEASLNGYAFCNINTETEVLARSTENILTYIMDEVSKNKAFQISSKLNVVDVEVDEITLNGSMGNIYVGTYYNIYADEIGTNNASESYLQIKLSNSDLPELDLQSKKVNLGIRFERKGTDGWSNANENISPVLGYGFVETLDEDDRTFYLLGYNTAWVVCANNVGAFEYRALIKYFVFDDDGDLKYTISLKDSENPTFAIQERLISDEKEVYWKDNSPITLTAVNLKLSEDETIVYEPEYDLNAIKFVDKDNAFKTVRYFIYSDDEEGSETLHEYFDTASDNFISYKLSDGKTRKLYELSSSTLKLKSIETIPNFETRVLFATVNPRNISSDGKYELIKVSTNQNTGVIDEIIITVQRSLTSMSGSAEILDNGNAGVVDEKDGAAITKTLKVASDTNEVLSVSIKSDDSMLTQALLSDIITIYGKTSHDAHENYVRVSSTLTYNKDAQHENYEIVFKLNTVDVLSDTTISLFIAYTINNQTYFYPVSVKVNEDSFDSFVLVAHTDNTIRYYIGDGLDITRIDYIEMSYAFKDDVLGINYKLYYVDGTSSEYVNKSEIFDENGYIIHKIFNFLGKEDKTQRDDWYLTTTDASVIVVGDGKIITSVKSGDATIVIHLDNVNDELAGDLGLRTIKFRVINTGYISSYTLKDNTTGTEGLTRDGYTQTNPFPNNGLTAVKTGSNENRIELDGKKEGGILSVVYTFQSDDVEPGAAASKTALDFRITIDDTSLNAFKAITGKDNLGDGQTSFIITKDLGADVAIKVIFYNEQLNLTIVLTLDIKAVIQLESLVVEYVGNSETILLDNSGNVPVYTVYAEANFKITATLNALAYYIYNDESHGQVFAFTALDVSTSVSDYKDVIISNKQTPNIGDMQYRIKFNVLANIRISDYAKNGITINLDKDATKSISLYSSTMTERILDRLSGTNNLGGSVDISFKSNVKAEDFHVGNNTLDLDFTTNNFEDKITTQITVNYAGKLVGTFNITIYPYNYEKADATRLCYFRGEKAILLLAGDVAVNVLTAQFNYQTFTMGSIKGLKDVFNVSTGEVLGVDDNLLYNINNSEAAKNQWNYILVSDDAGNTTKYYLVISKVLVLDSFLLSFNNADTLDGVDLRDIDIYEMLYVMESSNTLLNYYNNNNV
ncbi:MAG: hypothetical protein J6T74_00805, partial [Clostridia bacterium]|nr:hypothetical protein [Clostridia bacterium]